MTKKTTKPPLKPPLHAYGELQERVLARWDSIVALWAEGDSFVTIVSKLSMECSPASLRQAIALSPELVGQLNAVLALRSDSMVEQAVDWARDAARTGDPSGLKVGIDTFLKVASKVSPERYGDKSRVELTGANGGAIQTKADLTLSPADAYERMVSGK